jgi:hypothetical protein
MRFMNEVNVPGSLLPLLVGNLFLRELLQYVESFILIA